MADAQGEIDPFLDQIDEAIQQEKPSRNGRIEIEKIVEDGPQHLLATDWRRRKGQHSARGRAFACSEHVGFLEIDEHPAAGRSIAFARLAQFQRTRCPMQQFNTDMRFQKCQRPTDRRR